MRTDGSLYCWVWVFAYSELLSQDGTTAIRQSGPHRSTESAHAMGDGHPRALPTRRAQAAGRDAAAAPAAVAADPVERDGHPGVADQKGGN
jgi:hypothetical protein